MRTAQTSGKVSQSSFTRSSLARVLRYRNDAVVDRIHKELKLSLDEATILFEDTLKFLWLAGTFGSMIPPHKVDKGWHVFLLFTMDYQKFCHKYFGQFLHHRPNRPEDAPDDGSLLRRSKAIIAEHLGEVPSKNWSFGKADGACINVCGDGNCCGRDGKRETAKNAKKSFCNSCKQRCESSCYKSR